MFQIRLSWSINHARQLKNNLEFNKKTKSYLSQDRVIKLFDFDRVQVVLMLLSGSPIQVKVKKSVHLHYINLFEEAT